MVNIKNLAELHGQRTELKVEMTGKRSVLKGEFKLVEKGHPHWKIKKFIMDELAVEEANLIVLNQEIDKATDELKAGVANGK